jgi:hypothetical protein
MPRKPKTYDQNDPMVILSRVALEEQARKIEEQENKKRSRDQALKQMHASEEDAAARAFRMQSVCDHLLGTHRIGVKPREPRCAMHKDYLSDKSVRLYCGKCRIELHPGDTAEFLFTRRADGTLVKVPNPTKKGWRDMNEFFYSFENSQDLTSRAYRLERVEPEDIASEEARFLEEASRNVA